MTFDKLLSLYRLQNTADKGRMPDNRLVKISDEFYGERVVGYNRQYVAMGVNQRIDALVRIWKNACVRVNDFAILEDGNQYRVDMIQHLTDEDGLPVTDLTLTRMDDNYDVAS